MLRGAGQGHISSAYPTASGGSRGTVKGPRSRRAASGDRGTVAKALGFCCWVLAGGTAAFAIWELGNFQILIGNGPLLPSATREAPALPGVFRPAGEGMKNEGGCTQAPIDRDSGRTVPTDCHTWATGRGTVMAQL